MCRTSNRGKWFRIALGPAALLLSGLLAGCGLGQEAPERVVLVTIDTLRADRVGAYGDPAARTPSLDALADAGVRFDQAVAPTPLTLPSHTSLMTGLTPPQHGVRHNSFFALREEIPTLAERLRAEGFATAAFVGAFVLDSQFGLARGFDTYDDEVGQRHATPTPFSFAERTADRVVDAALEWLAHAPDRFFLWVHLYDPHANYDPPERYLAAVGGDAYAGEIAFADAQVGRLIRTVTARWDPSRLVVAVTSDHGESLGEHGEPSHGYMLYDATQRVPLFLVGPGLPAGAVVDEQVRLVDLAPTLLALAHAEPLPGTTGRSLLPLVAGRTEPVRIALLETLATQFDMGWSPLLGVRDGRYKYIRAPRPELYDLRADPGETRNLARRHPERVGEMDGILGERLTGVEPLAPNVDLDEEDRRRLESLGYVASTPDADLFDGRLGVVGGPDPKDHMAHAALLNNASTLVAEGRPEEALELLARVPAWGPRVLRYRAHAALAANRPELAIEAVRGLQGEVLRPRDRVVLGLAHLAAGRTEEARRVFREAREASPESPAPFLGSARLARLEGRLEEAAELLTEAERLASFPWEVRSELVLVRLEQGRTAEAEALLGAIPEAFLGRPSVAMRLASGLGGAGRREAALAHLRRAVAENPRHRTLLKSYAGQLEAAGRLEEALRIRERVLALDLGDPASRNDLAWSLALLGRDLGRALALARQAEEALPGDPAVLDTLATVHLLDGEPEAALRAAERGLEEAPTDLQPHLRLVRATALADLGREEEARSALLSLGDGEAALAPPWRERAAILGRRLGLPADETSNAN